MAEIRHRHTHGHWNWHVFPQIDGLGRSSAEEEFALRGLDEACTCLRDPILRSRYEESDAVERQLSRINEFSGYVDLKGACKYLSVGESQFKEWVRLGYIHPRKVSSHLVRYRLKELEVFMEEFSIKSRT